MQVAKAWLLWITRTPLNVGGGLAFAVGVVLAASPGFAAVSPENEFNAWPFIVTAPATKAREALWTGGGPFLFRQPQPEGTVSGFRPFWIEYHDRSGNFRAGHALYPLFGYHLDDTIQRWSVMELIRRIDRRPEAGPPRSVFEERHEFEVWPFWFSRESGDPDLGYRGLFPIAGTVKNKLGMDRFSWIAFPFYAEIEKRGAVTTESPWPFIRVTRGAAHGWGVWPIFNFVERPGVAREEFYLWPFGYNVTRQPSPDDPPGTIAQHDVGALPFYAKSTGPGSLNVSYLWPFFGYTDRTQPTRYSEQRYFWPLLVQGRGDDRYVSRWGPFYTHSIIKGYDKRWFAWPLVRHAQWTEEGMRRTKAQFLYFLYSAQSQRSLARPELPPASLAHYWPLLSTWNDGAGRRQWQFPSPLEVFFPGNDKMRQTWGPFFTLARFDQRAPGETRTSLLWNAVTWEQRSGGTEKEFHFGPLFSISETGDAKRVAFGNGVFGFRRSAAGWQMFWLDFPPKPVTTTAPSS